MTNPPQNPPPLELPKDLEPVYSNIVRISHTPSEFVLDFSRMLPGQFNLTVAARLLISPIAAKWFLCALTENIARYETVFGEIHLPGNSSLATDLFRNIHPPEPPPSE